MLSWNTVFPRKHKRLKTYQSITRITRVTNLISNTNWSSCSSLSKLSLRNTGKGRWVKDSFSGGLTHRWLERISRFHSKVPNTSRWLLRFSLMMSPKLRMLYKKRLLINLSLKETLTRWLPVGDGKILARKPNTNPNA